MTRRVTVGSYRGTMPALRTTYVAATPPRRHDHRVRSVSSDFERLRRLDHLLVDEEGAAAAISAICTTFGVPEPQLKFHSRRSPFTGATEAPRGVLLELARRRGIEPEHGYRGVPVNGAVRLGRTSSLMTIAHEVGHHLVFHLEPASTATHGNVWVGRFDHAASVITPLVAT